MLPVLSSQNVRKHEVKTGDTLDSIAKQYNLKAWQTIALYNWSTENAREVNRALIERIGCSKVDDENAHLTVLAPPKNPKLHIEIPAEPAPKLKTGLATNKNYDIVLKPLLPATAIGIRKLDKWFIPGIEECAVEYWTEGLKACADKVAFEVYGSNYCECSEWNNGLGKYTVLPAETPVYRRLPPKNKADERSGASIGKWKGEALPAKGILSVKTGMASRVLNAAFSPYTVSLRYYRNEQDATAALVLLPFWPRFKEKPAEKIISGGDVKDEAAEVVIKWTNAAEAHWGELTVKDKNGKAVYAVPLPQANLSAAQQEFKWNRKYNRGARNSRHLPDYLAADGPYSCEIVTVSGGAKTEHAPSGADVVDVGAKITVKWTNATNYTSATLDVCDRNAQKVYTAAPPTAAGYQEHDWNLAFNVGGAANSRGGAEYLGADGGYLYTIHGKHEQAPAAAVSAPKVSFTWDNAIEYDKVRLEVRDNTPKLVFSADVERKRGVQTYDWNKSYSAGVTNSAGGTVYLPADGYTYRIIAEKQHVASPTFSGGHVKIKWTNAAVAEQGLLTVTDKNLTEVFRADLAAHLGAAPQTYEWDKQYSEPALNSRNEAVYVAADGEYHYKVVTFAGGAAKTITTIPGNLLPQEMKVTLKWTNAAEADRGVLVISDARHQVVHTEVLPPEKLRKTPAPQEIEWKCGYRSDAWNSDFRQEYRASDGPYEYKVITFVREPEPESLKIEWLVKNTSKLECGHVRIVDGRDRLVFLAPLSKAQLAKSDGDKPEHRHSFTWDGKYSLDVKNSGGGDSVIAKDMPYRVQIQAHKDMNQPEGLALASMHTEVRLYVHPETPLTEDLSYNPGAVPASLGLEPGPIVPGNIPAAGSRQWYQYKLAEFGYHPGPANGATHAAYSTALKEFKRSVPKHKTGADYERLPVNDAEDNDLKLAIEHIRNTDKRRMFGDPAKVMANNDTPDLTDAEVKAALPDASREMIVWVDDRQYYTQGDPAKDDANNDYLVPPFNLGNPRGDMVCGDGRAKLDAATIPRPWIPLQAGPRLLGKDDGLDKIVDPPGEDAAKAMRRAIGPLRMDWTFSELAPDLSPIDTSLLGYDVTFVRSRYYVGWAIDKEKSKHRRKDTNRDVYYTNAKEYAAADGSKTGGIRSDNLAQYYKAAFGCYSYNLQPWRAVPLDDTESIATVLHDHLTGAQTEGSTLYAKLIGTAGTYFTPSRVAGDGYRVRAALRFEPFSNYAFPNLAVLKARYPVPPQVHSAALRVWRRTSFRGYMCWGPATNHWAGGSDFVNVFRAHYRGAHVYFVHEGGASHTFAITDVFNPAEAGHRTRYDNIIKNNTPDGNLKNNTTLSADYLWPWAPRDDFGYHYTSTAVNADAFQQEIWSATWRKWRAALLLALVREVEKKGYLRGHLMVEFKDSPACKIELYECNGATTHRFRFLWRNGFGNGHYNGAACPTCSAAGKTLASRGSISYADGLQLPAVGGALGATWLFRDGGTDDRLKLVWVHEVGHHRHLEHAADGPGANASLHDSEQNARFRGWDSVRCDGATPPTPALAMGWDRRCIMSYSDCNYGEMLCLCGRCLLRNRGWNVTGLGFPGRDKGDE